MSPFSLLRRAAAFFAIITISVSCIFDPDEPEGGNIGIGDELPEFTITLSDGTTVGTQDLRGSESLIMFFSTQCPDCQEVLPVVQSFYEEYSEQMRFILISREDGEENVKSYWQEHNLTLPYSAQNDRSVYRLFATSGIPRIYISGPDLIVRSVFTDSTLPTLEDLHATRSSVPYR